MSSKSTTIYLGLGSNLGSRYQNLSQALSLLPPQVLVLRQSSVYDTTPQDNLGQPRYLNMVVRASTKLAPEALLALVKNIEASLGRNPTPPNSPRPIDIDILFYDGLIYHTPTLTIPHSRLCQRAFVLVPLAEIAPRLRHPVNQKLISRLLKELPPQGQDVVKFDEENDVQANC